MPMTNDSRVLVGLGTPDDAGVVLVRSDLAVVQTIDVFGPVVDDPYAYGRIAAANALSDLYAMGVTPLTALAFAGFPEALSHDLAAKILLGGADTVVEAGALLIGGHTIRDAEPKYGLCVTGFAHPDAIVTHGGAKPGDSLVLTKPLGTGIMTSALKRGQLNAEQLAQVTDIMATLNREAAQAAVAHHVHAMTDVTGFGLLGHLGEMCHASGVVAEVRMSQVPVMEAVWPLVEGGCVPGGSRRNLQFVSNHCHFDSRLSEAEHLVLADAQTSGGLLIAVPEDSCEALVLALDAAGVAESAVIGRVMAAQPGEPRIKVSA